MRVERMARFLENPLARYKPTKGQMLLHNCADAKRILLKPNQTGGTVGGAVETLWHMTGRHPYFEVPPPPVRWRLVTYSNSQSLEIEEKLWDMLPNELLAPECRYDEDRGFRVGSRRILRLAKRWGGSSLTIVTQGQRTLGKASATLDGVWFDEPPEETDYSEGVKRIMRRRGKVLLTMTPIGRPVEWCREEVKRGALTCLHYPLTPEWVGFYSQAEIDAIIEETLPAERPQRIYAEWDGVTPDRYYGAWNDDRIVAPDFELPGGDYWVGVGIDHGEGAKKQIGVLAYVDQETGDTYLWDCAESTGKTDSARDALALVDMLAEHGLPPEAPDEWRGDHNTGGKSEAGLLANQLLEQEIADYVGRSRLSPPCRILMARKGPGSVAAGAGLLHRAMVRNQLWVHPRCAPVIDHFRHWRGPRDGSAKNQALTHAGDAVRYILRDQLDTRDRRHARIRRR